MKKNIIKIIEIFWLIILIWSITISVKAISPKDIAEETTESFLSYLEYGSFYALNYIDYNNSELYQTAQNRLNSYSTINYKITKVTENDGTYKVEAKIEAKGKSDGENGTTWEVNGMTANFDVKYIDGEYTITDTNFFEITSPEYIAGMAVGIVATVFLIIGIIFVGVVIVIAIIIIVVVKKNKKK